MHSSAKFAALVLAGVSSAAYAPQPYGGASSSSSSAAASSSSAAGGNPYGDASSTVSSSTGPVFTGPPDLPSFTLAPQAESSGVVSSSTCTEEGGPGPATGYGTGYPVGTTGGPIHPQATNGVLDSCGNMGKGLECMSFVIPLGTGVASNAAHPIPTGSYGNVPRNYGNGNGNGRGHGRSREHHGEFGPLQASGMPRPLCAVDYPGSYSSTVDPEGATQIFPVGPTHVVCYQSGALPSATWALSGAWPLGTGAPTVTGPPGNGYATSSVVAEGNGYASSSLIAEGASSSSAVVPEGYGATSVASSSAAATSTAAGYGQ